MAKQEISEFNEDVSDECDYCKEAASTPQHIRWQCKFFQSKREECDPLLAAVPSRYLLECIQCGVAPALKVYGDKTYWGMDVDDGEDDKVKKLLGIDLTLQTPGNDAEVTDGRKKAMEIIDHQERQGLNARQTMLKFKKAHGSGVDLEFPIEDCYSMLVCNQSCCSKSCSPKLPY